MTIKQTSHPWQRVPFRINAWDNDDVVNDDPEIRVEAWWQGDGFALYLNGLLVDHAHVGPTTRQSTACMLSIVADVCTMGKQLAADPAMRQRLVDRLDHAHRNEAASDAYWLKFDEENP